MKKQIENLARNYHIEEAADLPNFKDWIWRQYLTRHTPQDMDEFDKEFDEFFAPYMNIPKVVYNLYDRNGMNGWNIPEDIEHGFLSEHDVDGLTVWHYYDGGRINEAVDENGKFYEDEEADELLGF